MTIIAWDGTTLAADKRAIAQSHCWTITKIARVGEFLVGVSGRGEKIREFQQWIERGRVPEQYPKRNSEEEWFCGLVIGRDGVIEHYEASPLPMIVEDPTHAIGTARDFARAAMHLGKTAREAVELACLFSADCGNGVDSISFSDG